MVILGDRTSTGSAFGHAGEFLQGAVFADGALCRILISIPAPSLRSSAIFTSSIGSYLAISPEWKQKSLRAFQLAWQQFSDSKPSGLLEILSEIPVSRGMGSSTADCVAAIRAAALFWNCALHADQIAMLAHQAECFSDATIYEDRLVVFQHCEGRIHEHLDGVIPDLQLAIVEPLNDGDRIDTNLLVRPNYTADETQQFAECLSRFRRAYATNDLAEIGAIANISAQINQRYHPKRNRDSVERISSDTQALGVAIAHSGDIQVLLYRPGSLSSHGLRTMNTELEQFGMRCCRVLSTRSGCETADLIPSG
jgi:uncharacterized protein involved in propanediol utilization